MKLELSIPRDRYLVGENINVDVRLTNTGPAAVDAPKLANFLNTQPVYHLKGPSFPDGVSFSLRDVKLANQPNALRTEDAPATHRLGPGEQLEVGVKLHRLKRPALPGDYELSAQVQWPGWTAKAAAIRFRVDSASYLAASLGVDLATSTSRRIRAVWLAQTATGRVLGETFQYESRPDLGEFDTTGSRIITAVGEAATAPFCPWTNFERTEVVNGWHGWREGSRLFAIATGQVSPQSIDTGGLDAEVVRPALLSRSGDMDVVLITRNGTSLQLIRFAAPAAPSAARAATPRVLWSLDLPEPVQVARVGLAPASAGGAKAAVLVSRSDADIGVRILRLDDAAGSLSSRVSIRGGVLVAASEPAVSIGAGGEIRSSLVYASENGLRSLMIADLSMPPTSTQPTLKLTPLGQLDAPATLTATAYRSSDKGIDQRSWLAGTAVGALVGGGSTVQPVPTLSANRVTDFLRMSGAAYVLDLDPQRGPALKGVGF